MRYLSTRGQAPLLNFDDTLLAGLAADGGLYIPESWPYLSAEDLRSFRGLSYADLAVRVMQPFIGGRIARSDFERLVHDSYRTFGHPAVAPLTQVDTNLWLMELFHGPTLAFKDVAMQLLGRLFDHVLKQRGERITIVGATSGDTGSAAIEACRDRAAIEIFMLFPKGRVSEVQRRQMTTVPSPNVHAIEIDGTFDDCQDLVKAMFNDAGLRSELRLSAVNSINWVRVLAQIVYYVHAAVSLGAPDRPVSFSVPSGNFGNIFAGYAARAMGVPVAQLVVGSNRNDILTRFFTRNDMTVATVEPTLSPSMDIQVSSNFERLLFDLLDRDGPAVEAAVGAFRETGRLPLDDARWQRAAGMFAAHSIGDARTKEVIAALYRSSGMLIDPHTAIGVDAARVTLRDPAVPMVSLATAHPAKFPDAVEDATGVRPALPAHMADLFDREERMASLPNDFGSLTAFVRENIALESAV